MIGRRLPNGLGRAFFNLDSSIGRTVGARFEYGEAWMPAGRGSVRCGRRVNPECAGGERYQRPSQGETSRVNQALERRLKGLIGAAGAARRPRRDHNLCREESPPPLCCSRLRADRVALDARSARVTCPAGRSPRPRRTPPPRAGHFRRRSICHISWTGRQEKAHSGPWGVASSRHICRGVGMAAMRASTARPSLRQRTAGGGDTHSV